jgi:hypothetical protein
MSKSDLSIETFWKEKELIIGSPVLSKALVKCLAGKQIEKSLWGLLFCTKDRIYFEHFPQGNWLSNLTSNSGGMLGSGGDGKKDLKQQHVTFDLELTPHLVLEGSEPSGWKKWLSSEVNSTFSLVDLENNQVLLQFVIEQPGTTIVETLRDILKTVG